MGDALANVLDSAGYDVTREYYINDVGSQMATLGRSLFYRYREFGGITGESFPEDHYRGEYLKDIARDFLSKHGDKYLDKEPQECIDIFTDFARDSILGGIKDDLEHFGVSFDVWYSERKLHDAGLVTKTIKRLKELGHVFEKDGALWFRTTTFGDDKDRVLKKSDGSLTYFAADVAYHLEKIERGFESIVDVWGADHHGYQARMKALFSALGADEEMLKVIFIQLVSLSRGAEPVAMSTRAGEFVTLKEVLDEVGRDACRYFFLMRKSDAHLDFDLELAKKQAPENPVYYVQYCYARIQSIFGFAEEKGISVPIAGSAPPAKLLARLEEKEELTIIKYLGTFPEVVEKSAAEMEPHRITFYLQELAGLFHPYYNRNRVVTDDAELASARLWLCAMVACVVEKGLAMLGVSVPKKM